LLVYYISVVCISVYLFVRPVWLAIGGHTTRPIRPKINRNNHWDNAMKIWGSAIANAHLCARFARKRARSITYPTLAAKRLDRSSPKLVHTLIGKKLAKVMGVADRECALMCALRAQTCARHYTSSIGGQTGERIGAQIVTNTHWNNGQKLWVSTRAGAH
jgi:hypothetical protein